MAQFFDVVDNVDDVILSLKTNKKREEKFTWACFASVDKKRGAYVNNDRTHAVNGFYLIDQAIEFVNSFNDIMKNMRLILTPLSRRHFKRAAEHYPYTDVIIKPYLVELEFSEESSRAAQWEVMIPIVQLVRAFGPRYDFYREFDKDLSLKGVIEKSVEIISKKYSSRYGLWSVHPITYEEFLNLDNPEILEEVGTEAFKCRRTDGIKYSAYAAYPYPMGTLICKILQDVLKKRGQNEIHD